jgi:anti-sigma factor RsiW
LNAIGEFDSELLEDYLDDALSPVQVEHVARRLAEEPELALAMHELRASRVLRAAVWRSLEPSAAGAASVAGRVAGVVRADARRRNAQRSLWAAGSAAAVAAVFVIGWSTRMSAPAIQPPSNPTVIAHVTQPAPAAVRPAGVYHVTLVDQHGRLLPAQKFAKADDARQFARDLLQYEDRRREAEQGGAMLVSDHF